MKVADSIDLVKTKCLCALKVFYQTRFMDDKMQKLVYQNKGGTFHVSSYGHELVGIISAHALQAGKDWGLPYYRDRAFALGLGCAPDELFGAFLTKEVPHHSGGRMMPEHFSHKELRIPCQSSVVGSQFLQAVGIAKAASLAESDEVVYVSGGDGSSSQGDFHEALNYSCIHRLGVIFVIQDNGWAISVPSCEQTAGESIASMAQGYSELDVYDVDGCDYESLTIALDKAITKGRSFQGPSLIVAKVPRIGSHSSSDDPTKYKKRKEIEEDRRRDPLPRFEQWLIQKGYITEEEINLLRKRIKEEIELAAESGERYPLQGADHVLDCLYKNITTDSTKEGKRGEVVVMKDGINHALDEEMEHDEGVVIFGQDVSSGKGGVFGVTQGIIEKYGKKRCFNTPLAESTIIGTAIGISIHSHFKPVVEIQFSDYIWTGMNQLFNELASYYYRSNGEWHCPIVVRIPSGGYVQGGPYHSQSVEAFLVHCPGLKVVMPSNAADAKMLLKSAIRDPNPVIFLEHKALYRQRVYSAQPEPTANEFFPIGKAQIVRYGRDITLICWGFLVYMAHDVAQNLKEIDVEIIDICTLSPLDFTTILESVKKTGRVLVVHEAPQNCGFGAEIAARLAEFGFEYLDAPVKRLGGLNTCVPYAKHLERAVLPQKDDILVAIQELYNY